jgi:DSF synthase
VVDLWADAALRLSEADLKLMRRLVTAQTRLLEKAQARHQPAAG